jgi:transcriptional regulator with XRE-family HTH domain
LSFSPVFKNKNAAQTIFWGRQQTRIKVILSLLSGKDYKVVKYTLKVVDQLYFTIKRALFTFVTMSNTSTPTMHIGRKIEGIRELRGMKQESLAAALGISQQAVSKMEASEQVDEERLQKVAQALDVPVEAIKNYSKDAAINVFGNTITNTNHDQSALVSYQPTFNPIDKIVELYERLLKSEQEKNALLESQSKRSNS